MSSQVAAAVRSFGRVGETISGKYRIIGGLGEGAAGCVYLAENVEIRRQVALKVLHPVLARSGEATGRFRREAQAAAAIRHPNIVDVLDMGRTDDGVPYFVMELLEGETLRALMDRSGALPVGQAVDIAQQVLSALSAAHAASIVHRDLKPSNVFIARHGGGTVVKVLDFGVAKYRQDSASPIGGADRARLIVGTPHYMSPEQARGRGDVGGPSDLYSVGVLLFEMISACRPHEGATQDEILDSVATKVAPLLGTVAPTVPEELSAVVKKVLERDPAQRTRTADELRAALAPFADTIDLGDIDIPSAPACVQAAPGAPGEASAVQSGDRGRTEPTLIVERPRRVAKWVLAVPVVVAAVAVLAVLKPWETRVAPVPPPLRVVPLAPGEARAGRAQVSLAVDSNVAGARVLLDGREIGVTPLRTATATGGSGVVRVEADGHLAGERRVDLSRAARVFVELVPRPAAPIPEAGRTAPAAAEPSAATSAARSPGRREAAVAVPPAASAPDKARATRPVGPSQRTPARSAPAAGRSSHPGRVIFDPFAP